MARRTKLDVEDLITPAEAAKLRGVSNQAIVDLLRRGRLTKVEIGGRPFVSRREVESFKPVRKGWPKGKKRTVTA
jgi:excisionase family DNA binding protein